MFRRMLITTIVAAGLLAAAPALAEQRDREAEPQKHAACCEGYAAQVRELTERVAAAEMSAADAAKKAAPPTIELPSVL